jgi:peptide chain release factor 3
VLQFEYGGSVVNLLDTPGHKDFSEDTYRVLTAVDAAIMVIDAGKGIETQTRKLFEVCRKRGVPIFTFMNKLDRPARDPLELLDELESVLGIGACAMNWPLGNGPEFRGIFDRLVRELHLFERTPHGAFRAPVKVGSIEDEAVRSNCDPDVLATTVEELKMLDGAGHAFERARVDAGELTPVFFGSAANNFGVQLLLDAFLKLAPAPRARFSRGARLDPAEAGFSGFVFKIQANMDPRHRDRIYFIRIVSGKFERDMQVTNTRTGKKVRLSNSQRLFAQERETVDESYAGDVVGVVGNHDFQIGDALALDAEVVFDEIPRFAPECFAFIHNPSTAQSKRFREGLSQLLAEGVMQSYSMPHAVQRIALLGAVGPLQFEVAQYRLESEYGAQSRIEPAPWRVMRWIRSSEGGDPFACSLPTGSSIALDSEDQPVALFPDVWPIKLFTDRNPGWEVSDLPFGPRRLEV